MNADSRAQELHPAALKKAEADAGAAESDSLIKAEEASAAPQAIALKLKQASATLGLTNAQISQTVAAAKKLTAETQAALASAQAGGDPKQNFDAELKLRKEYDSATKSYQEVTEAYRRVKAAADNGPGDIALIYGYMKMLDPGSVVREGEFATASNSGGIPTTIKNLYNKAISGQRLTAGQRKTFSAQAGKLAEAARERETEVRSGLSTVVKNYRLNPDNVFGTSVRPDGETKTAANPSPGKSTDEILRELGVN